MFQPADVGLNRIIKHFMQQEVLEYLVKSHRDQIKKGQLAKQVKFTSSLPALWDATVQPLIKLYDYFQSYEGLEEVLDATLRKEIEDKIGMGLELNDVVDHDDANAINGVDSEDYDDPTTTSDVDDDMSVPLQVVVCATLGLRVDGHANSTHEVSQFIVNSEAIEQDTIQRMFGHFEMEMGVHGQKSWQRQEFRNLATISLILTTLKVFQNIQSESIQEWGNKQSHFWKLFFTELAWHTH
ncbi:hypothetical protein L208DRAFT_1381417 [Tricholoma matsutake]|nr:hypothetical protein L208DRAFT_1381417 [Tricholoma matsutake 945]